MVLVVWEGHTAGALELLHSLTLSGYLMHIELGNPDQVLLGEIQ